MRLTGKTVLVTGAARGVGRACARRFAEEGADLMLLDIGRDVTEVPYPLGTASQLDRTADICRKNGASVLTHLGDVRDDESVGHAVRRTVDRFGAIDVLINNAGVAAPSGKMLHSVTDADWDAIVSINLTGVLRVLRNVVPVMLEQRSGSVVNVASTAGLVGYRYFGAYCASKHAVVGLTRSAALDYAPFDIRVNALCPGSIRDDADVEARMLGHIGESLRIPVSDHEKIFRDQQPNNQLVEPDDVAGAALWLAGDDSRKVTGAVIAVDGGYSVR